MFQRHHASLSLNTLSESQKHQCMMQTNQDLANRSIPGTFFYLVVWFCIAYLLSDPDQQAHVTRWIDSISLLIVSTSIIRVGLISLSKRHPEETQLSQTLLIIGMVVSSLSWGVMASLAFLDTPLASQQNLIFLSTIGLCGGGSLSFCASRIFTTIFLICMLLPIFIVQIYIKDTMDLGAVMIVTIYFIGLLSATKQPYREYLSSLVGYLKLEEISNTDALTDLRNRRFFDAQLEEEVRRARRNQSPLSIIFIDADHFKAINDKYGHPIGDKCLIHLASQLKQSFNRVSDTVARFGGEEFAIILPNISKEHCLELAERIRKYVDANPLDVKQEKINLTISIGICSVQQLTEETSLELLVSKTDEALYEAKRLGRNRTEVVSI